MKNNLRRTIAILKLFKENAFYSITFTEFDIKLQGEYTCETAKIAKAARFEGTVMADGWIHLTRGVYTIVLEA